jgi:hypothetical protein
MAKQSFMSNNDDEVIFILDREQVGALRALLELVHYDTLAESWRRMLPDDMQEPALTQLCNFLWADKK